MQQLFRLGAAALSLACLPAFASVEKNSTWTVDASGLWTEPGRWSTPSFPANSGTNLYSATIDMPNRTVTLDTNLTLQSFALSRSVLYGSNAPTLLLNEQFDFGAAQNQSYL